MRAILLALLLASPALAEPPPGASDPAFSAPFQRALQGDDPSALTDLHAAAEAGNTAALLALPAVTDWLRQTLPFADRKKLARVNGVALAAALAEADPVAALWGMGDPGDNMADLLTRAFGLYAAGEADKGSMLFMTWLNQTGGFMDLPPGFFDQPIPVWARSWLLQTRLLDTTFGPPSMADTLLADRLRAGDPGAAMALAAYARIHRTEQPAPEVIARINAIGAAAGVAPDDLARRMAAAVPVLRVMTRAETALDPATAQAAVAALATEPEFAPLPALCAATCPLSADACTTAFVAAFGHPFARNGTAQPFVALMPPEQFFATPRGRKLLLRSTAGVLGSDPAASPALAAARAIDACLADAVLAAQP
ncbi:MAG: hypothetical protein KBF78_15990 [Fuscovulum sp.]|nr:hypothetical protein [Fuscovulum sp.]